ncbi:MAG: hypothetical protein E6868_22680 [Pantoea sp.]|jgi:hypothetical protein|uniref:hypothetical protein n=2 Tax=Enterobacterales TaxID=91347 RepID=UPI002904ED25|nr:hypothetical protein [Pantoea sp.]MDU1576020.1 hypothetical protein [Pantoea sp.]MDU1664549.1 hypothetical protein [Peptoniphilus harei]
MIHKIIGGKTKLNQRNIKNSISYLLREKKKEEQEFIKVLSGSKDHMLNFNKLIASKNLKTPYIAGVLSFEEENIEEQAKFKIMEDFEAMAFAGVPEEYRPPVLWVEHRDKGRLELNYLTFNALTTGRSFAVYYDKKDRRLLNDFTEIVNYEGGYSSPFDDFTNTQKIRMAEPPGKTLPAEKKALVEGLNNRLCSLILERKITNKAELITYLQEKEGFKINRIAKNTVSIITDLDDTPIRLKGDIYQDGRDFGDYFKEKQAKPERTQAQISEKLSNHKPSYQKGLECRTERNRRVYIDPIIRRQQKEEELNKLTIKKEAEPAPVTILKEKIYDNKRQSTPSPASEIFIQIERIGEQQQEINKQQQFINKNTERSRSRTVELGNNTKGNRGRLGFFRDYFNRFSQHINEKLRSVIEFAAEAERKVEEKTEQKQEVRAKKVKVKRRPQLGGRYRKYKEDDELSN